MKKNGDFEFGDVVTKNGDDEHLVLQVTNQEWNLITIICIKEPPGGWTKVGELDDVIGDRYQFVSKMINPEKIVKRYQES